MARALGAARRRPPPKELPGYQASSQWKRALHAERGTALLEPTWAEVLRPSELLRGAWHRPRLGRPWCRTRPPRREGTLLLVPGLVCDEDLFRDQRQALEADVDVVVSDVSRGTSL